MAAPIDRAALFAVWILEEFDAYYTEFLHTPALAKRAFESRAHRTSIGLSRHRLSLYSDSMACLADVIAGEFPNLASDSDMWLHIERQFRRLITGRYEADVAFAYLHSVRRRLFFDEWTSVAYGVDEPSGPATSPDVIRRFQLNGLFDADVVRGVLGVVGFEHAFRDLSRDAAAIRQRVLSDLEAKGAVLGDLIGLEMLRAGFFRNRGAYLVGALAFSDGRRWPFIVALLNDDDGIYVDALLTSEADAHNIFSSTLANFHVTNPHYHQLAEFLHALMPARPLGLHYSTIGYNHLGKVAVMRELENEVRDTDEVLQTSVGSRGSVAMGFAAPSSAYNLKVVRNTPTNEYKWGVFDGIDSVLRKYNRVHEINRTGSMLDNIIYFNVKLEASWFDSELLEELLRDASVTVHQRDDGTIVFKHLIVQRRLTPLPVFLETASDEDVRTVIVNLGYCIKNNAAADIFNKDLDARNYGVSRFMKVYLFDYDALEVFGEIKIRTNVDRFDGEEDIPDWVYEDGIVFLPEEVESGLCLPGRRLRRMFRYAHGDLLELNYWSDLQSALADGGVPQIRIYPRSTELS